MDFKNLKIVKKIKDISKLKWLMFSKVQDLKIGSKYLDYLITDETKDFDYDNQKLVAMVRDTLIKEFGQDIQKNKSYELLVDAVVHNIKKKQLGENGEIDVK